MSDIRRFFEAPIRQGTVSTRNIDTAVFPLDAWEFDRPEAPSPTLRLNSPWILDATVLLKDSAGLFDAENVEDGLKELFLRCRMKAYAVSGQDYTLTTDDGIGFLSVNPSGSDRTVKLPTASAFSSRSSITVRNSGSSNLVHIDGYESETVEGVSAIAVYPQVSITVRSDGSSWHVVCTDPPLIYVPRTYSSDVYANTGPSAGTFYTVTLSDLPDGAKRALVTASVTTSAVGYNDHLVWRVKGSSDTYSQSKHRLLVRVRGVSTYDMYYGGCALVEVDSNKEFEVAVGTTYSDIYIYGWTHYSF